MPDIQGIIAIIGAIALFAGLFGGFRAKDLEVPALPKILRFSAFFIGVAFIGIAIWPFIRKEILTSSSAVTVTPTTTNDFNLTPTFTPELRPTDKPVISTPTDTSVFPTKTSTPPPTATTDVPAILSTPTPISLGMLSVPGNSSEGIKFTANQSGQYIFRYVRGSYSTYPIESIPDGTPTWLTAVRIFKNRSVAWEGDAISNSPDLRAVDFGYSSNFSDAETKAQNQTAVISLLQGDHLILVGVDGRPYYSDNPGEVVFEVLFIPTQ